MTEPVRARPRSYLYAPGHAERLLAKVFSRGADEVILDLEDAVPPEHKEEARFRVLAILRERAAQVRINAPRTAEAERDLEVIAGNVADIKVPKVEHPDDLAWVAERAAGVRLHPILESAKGVLAAREIAAFPGVVDLSLGLQDLSRELGCDPGWHAMYHVRATVVLVSSAEGLAPPVDSVFPHLDDLNGLRAEAKAARDLGFFGKAALNPRQVAVINEVFDEHGESRAWAEEVVAAFESSGGAATRTASGDFVDRPVYERALKILGRRHES